MNSSDKPSDANIPKLVPRNKSAYLNFGKTICVVPCAHAQTKYAIAMSKWYAETANELRVCAIKLIGTKNTAWSK